MLTCLGVLLVSSGVLGSLAGWSSQEAQSSLRSAAPSARWPWCAFAGGPTVGGVPLDTVNTVHVVNFAGDEGGGGAGCHKPRRLLLHAHPAAGALHQGPPVRALLPLRTLSRAGLCAAPMVTQCLKNGKTSA